MYGRYYCQGSNRQDSSCPGNLGLSCFQIVSYSDLPSGVLIVIEKLVIQAFVELPIAAFNLIQSSKESQQKNVEIYSAKGPVFSTAIIAGKRQCIIWRNESVSWDESCK